LGFGLIKNHPFLDGNKRIGTHAMLVFLGINGIALSYEDQELIAAIIAVTSGAMDDRGLLIWRKRHRSH
ncbi:MAG: type II toxin-antitoxin system death-on-curing family toxin, partial [Butyricicoccaceae bacterium]